ncbi:MAG: glyoxalase/bleomycin resistance/extradiol dioxygenase family protein [Saprospiraceae bacterium]|nr:glyoxalase/bleomycin resistance/extradiol dioxygenase family protein [Saprospiraceae bacterium]
MSDKTTLLTIVPVLPSADIERDIAWYKEKTGFEAFFFDKMYAGLRRDNFYLHLQWHADTENDPLLGGSVIRIFVKNIQPIFEEFVQRGTVSVDKFRANTPWGTNEFGFWDLNQNAIFIVEEVE